MADINHLAEVWRQTARALGDSAHAEMLYACADEVEEAWHNHAHDAAWYPEECQLCVQEMTEEGLR